MSTGTVIYLCRFEGCRRAAAFPGQARCEDHRLRWVPREPVEQDQDNRPQWVQRMALNAKILSGGAA